jgi:hypothetical protein
MARATYPATPNEELTARRAWTGPVLAGGVLTPALAEFLQSGVSIVLATRSPNGWPIAGRGLGVRVDGTGRVRVLLRRDTNAALVLAVAGGAGVSASFSEPATHRTIQLKAARFSDELVDVGYPRTVAEFYLGYEPGQLAAFGFVPAEARVQTPGPGAGAALTA